MNEKQEALEALDKAMTKWMSPSQRVSLIAKHADTIRAALTPSPVTPTLDGVSALKATIPGLFNAPVTPDASGLPEEIWPLPDGEQRRTLDEAINFKWHHVLVASDGYWFADFSKETWGALPIGVIETLRIKARTPSSLAELEAEVESLKGVVKDCYSKLSAADAYAEALQAKLTRYQEHLEWIRDNGHDYASKQTAREALTDKEESE